ncbi:ABC transporter permease [Cyclobacterium plantarum]|uniref:ABC transporter permease n=1 Tax=Cyclobacterium plantarum TaxID=2716263 RepID=A0ABX0H1K6_9BACT|nr:ABC transporter permease [Cyclobacterium plantarum]NHE55317.1 ABC transporter permease [Cyclobacterium plantarum]
MKGKIFLVIKREYLARVKKRSFLLATIITPLIFPTILGLFLWIAMSDVSPESRKFIEVVDENNAYFLENNESFTFSYGGLNREEARELVNDGDRFGFLYIPELNLDQPTGITFYSEEIAPISMITSLEAALKNKIEEFRLFASGIDPDVLSSLKTNIKISAVILGEPGGERVSNSVVNYAVGFLAGILIYTFIFVYGNQIMQGVIEEKSSRIIEILVSSLKPFQLMMGKIIGIGAVGLTQFLIWILLISAISSLVVGYFGMKMPQQELMEMSGQQDLLPGAGQEGMVEILQMVQGIDFIQLTLTFLIYFVGGYLLYGAFFAAIGAAVDSPSDAQQFMFPVTIPLLIAYMGLFIFVLDDPNSNVSFWLSIIPFTSPVAMMGRVSFGVPWEQLAISIGLLVAGFLFTTWLAGKIYRIGILVHGSKVGYKVLWKWLKDNS